MADLTPPPRIPLPNGWSRRVRSAVIHAISLAHFSCTHPSLQASHGTAREPGSEGLDRGHQMVTRLCTNRLKSMQTGATRTNI